MLNLLKIKITENGLDLSQNTNIKLMYYLFLNTFSFMWTLIIMEGVQDLMTMLFFKNAHETLQHI